jgi:ubiquinone/menaquinone biosynthesis C-methylase UbiE
MIEGKPPGAGRSSFEQIDQSIVFPALRTGSTVFIDLGCGRGDYVMAVAEQIGPGGKIYGIDAWQPAIDELSQRISDRGLKNIEAILSDVTTEIPLPDHVADVCLMAHVLHDFKREGGAEEALRGAARVLKPDGILAIIEPKKIEAPYGPPLHVRLAPEEVEELIRPFGFIKESFKEVGTFENMIIALSQGRNR